MSAVPPGAPPPQIAEVTSTPAVASSSVDRIAFSAIVVSCATKQAYVIPSILSFDTSKSDNGDAGTFTITFPMAQTYAQGLPNPAPAYAAIANPMDVIAIYALRVVSTDTVVAGVPTSVPQTAPSSVSWGQAGFIDALIEAGGGNAASSGTSVGGLAGAIGGAANAGAAFSNGTCIFIGMLDEPAVPVEVSGQPTAHFTVTGHDLTKIFMSNDSALPAIIAAAGGYNADESMAPIIFAPRTGADLVEEALDYMVARVAPDNAEGQSLHIPPGLSVYAFPWRNFISTELLNPDFTPLNPDLIKVWPYRIQDGTAWSNMTDLRNSPIGRLFVDEFGNLIFDDSYHAWINDDGSNPSAYTITQAEVLSYRFSVNDGDLITALSVWPSYGLMSAATASTLYILKGNQIQQLLPGGEAGAQMASPVAFMTSNIQRYGMRYGQYVSFWDLSLKDASNRWSYLVVNHNSICFADVMVRGRPIYHAGMRVTLDVPAHRPEFLNAEWYVTNVSHSGSYGSTWTTHLQLRYPKVNGAIH